MDASQLRGIRTAGGGFNPNAAGPKQYGPNGSSAAHRGPMTSSASKRGYADRDLRLKARNNALLRVGQQGIQNKQIRI